MLEGRSLEEVMGEEEGKKDRDQKSPMVLHAKLSSVFFILQERRTPEGFEREVAPLYYYFGKTIQRASGKLAFTTPFGKHLERQTAFGNTIQTAYKEYNWLEIIVDTDNLEGIINIEVGDNERQRNGLE